MKTETQMIEKFMIKTIECKDVWRLTTLGWVIAGCVFVILITWLIYKIHFSWRGDP